MSPLDKITRPAYLINPNHPIGYKENLNPSNQEIKKNHNTVAEKNLNPKKCWTQKNIGHKKMFY